MSIIEEAVKRVADQGARLPFDNIPSMPATVSRPRLRRVAHAPVDVSQVRKYQPVAMDPAVLELNRILPRITDRAAQRAFKILRTRVLHRMEANHWHSLAVTGIVPGEGKTLNAVNLAMALAQDLHTWVFLVDLDLQRPQVARSIGIDVQRGLGDYLLGEATLEEIVYDPGWSRLAVIPNSRPLTSEHLTSQAMLDLMAALEREAPRRIVIYDMPPVLASDDVLAFAPQVDGMLLVVSEGMTQRRDLEKAGELLAEMNLLGVVLNRSRERNDNAYYGVDP